MKYDHVSFESGIEELLIVFTTLHTHAVVAVGKTQIPKCNHKTVTQSRRMIN